MWIKIVLAIVVLVIAGIIGLSYFWFHFLFARPKRSKKVPKFYIDTPHYKVSRAGMAIMDKLPVEDVYMTSRDGLKLHAYLYPAEGEQKKFIIGIHGYKSYARPEYGPYIAYYQSLGYSMLLPDDRAHAPSEGRYIGLGVLDRLDCVDWAKYLVERFGADTEIRLHGVSMGAATVLSASAEEDLPQQVKSVVADCGYSSIADEFHYQFKENIHMPACIFMPLIEGIAKHRVGIDFTHNSPVEQVKHARVPILFVQGEKDPMVPAWMVHKLYDACTSEKRLLVVAEAGHAESIAFEPEKYHAAIQELFSL